jgi:hypothetical protein
MASHLRSKSGKIALSELSREEVLELQDRSGRGSLKRNASLPTDDAAAGLEDSKLTDIIVETSPLIIQASPPYTVAPKLTMSATLHPPQPPSQSSPMPAMERVTDEKYMDQELEFALDELDKKRNLIMSELDKITGEIKTYSRAHTKLARWDKIAKTMVKLASALATVALLIGIDQRSNGSPVDSGLYYLATGSTIFSFVLGQVTDSWTLQERSQNHRVTYKGLQNLHDFISYQMVRNHLSSVQMDSILSDVSTRLILIRDSADGTLHEVSSNKHPLQPSRRPQTRTKTGLYTSNRTTARAS